ncbi:MAG TPA: peroxiredoxin [Acidimicrobiales bacterium]|nr:peroxiredoxin [Acidimicrobiales bacterium]
MAIAVGDRVPDVEVKTMGPEGPVSVRTGDVLGAGRVVLFAVPGAFTPGCSKIHLPGYVAHAGELRARGVGTIACVSVNDPWVMQAWADAQGVGDAIVMLADGNAEFTRAMGLEWDASGAGLGVRSKRYAAVLDEGVVISLEVEPKAGVDVSSCESVLARL